MYVMAMVPVGPASQAGLMNGGDANSQHMQHEYSGYQNMPVHNNASATQYSNMQTATAMPMSTSSTYGGVQWQAANHAAPYSNMHAQSQMQQMQASTSAYAGGPVQTSQQAYMGGSMRASAPAYTGGTTSTLQASATPFNASAASFNGGASTSPTLQASASPFNASAASFNGGASTSPTLQASAAPFNASAAPFNGGASTSPSLQASAAPFNGGQLQSAASSYVGGGTFQPSATQHMGGYQTEMQMMPSGQAGQAAPYAGIQSPTSQASTKSQQMESPHFAGTDTLDKSSKSEATPAPKKPASQAYLIKDPKTGKVAGEGRPPAKDEPTKAVESAARPVSIRDPRTGAIIAMRAGGDKAFAIRDPKFVAGLGDTKKALEKPFAPTAVLQRPQIKLDKVSDLIRSTLQTDDGIDTSTAGKSAHPGRAKPPLGPHGQHGVRKRWADDDESESTSSWISEAVTRSWVGEGSEDTPCTQSPRQLEAKPTPSTQELESEGALESANLLVSNEVTSDLLAAVSVVNVDAQEKEDATEHELKPKGQDDEESDEGFVQVKSRKKGGKQAAAKAKSALAPAKPQLQDATIVQAPTVEISVPAPDKQKRSDEARSAPVSFSAIDTNAEETRTASLPSKIPGTAAKPQADKSRTASLPSKESQVLESADPKFPRGAMTIAATQDFGVRDSSISPSCAGISPSSRSWRSLKSSDSFISREEDLKRQVLSLLNKLCPENLQVIISRMNALEISSSDDLTLLLRCIVSKALVDPHYCDVYADVVFSIQSSFPEFTSEDGGKPVTFKPALLNICQAEFESMPKDLRPTAEDLESCDADELALRTKRRKDHILANMRFIGKLFLRKLLPAAVIGSVMKDLMLCDRADVFPEEHCVECVLELLFSVGLTLETTLVGRQYLTLICGRLADLLRQQKAQRAGASGQHSAFSRRIQFAIQELLQTRTDGWARKTFKSCAKTRDAVRREQEADERKGINTAGCEIIIAGQRPDIMEDKTPTAQERRR